jgi:hypothetical protein
MGTTVVVSPKQTHRACGQAQTAWYSVPPQVSEIVDEHEPPPVLVPPPFIVQPASGGGGAMTVPPSVSEQASHSPSACSRHASSPEGALALSTAGAKHSNGMPPLSTQVSAVSIAWLQVQSSEHSIRCAAHPISMHAQQDWKEPVIRKSKRFVEHVVEDPDDPTPEPPEAIDPLELPLDVDPEEKPLDVEPDEKPLDVEPEPEPDEDPLPPWPDESPLPGKPPPPVSSRPMSLRPQAAAATVTVAARSPTLRLARIISALSAGDPAPVGRSIVDGRPGRDPSMMLRVST